MCRRKQKERQQQVSSTSVKKFMIIMRLEKRKFPETGRGVVDYKCSKLVKLTIALKFCGQSSEKVRKT
jgi:hypothetical protein